MNVEILTRKNIINNNEIYLIKEKIKNKNYLLQFLPESLDYLTKNKTISYKNKNLKTDYLIDIIHFLILKYYFKGENRFNLSSLILKKKYGQHYNYYIEYLISENILNIICNHVKGITSRCYSLNNSILKSKIKRYCNYDKILIKKYKKNFLNLKSEQNKNTHINDDVKIKLINDLFHVDIKYDEALKYLKVSYNTEDNIENYNINKYVIDCIKNKHIFYSFDDYGRLHTNFTILKSHIRKNFILIDNEETYEIDIKNSQPLFFTKLIHASETKWVYKDEFELFKKLTISGQFYNYLMEKLNIDNKELVKKITYKVLFGKNSPKKEEDIMFKKLFPTIYNFIKMYKKEKNNYKVIAYELQKLESNFIFNIIVKNLIKIYPNIKIITIHDSIIIPKSKKDDIASFFNNKLKEEFSF